ncbi:hypothetical protein [Streptomyces uncialis]|uniref:hypothetical protein n=1 Tax=Streptomyces uncialis TaxID=1048205 RepID=UPI0033D6D4AA
MVDAVLAVLAVLAVVDVVDVVAAVVAWRRWSAAGCWRPVADCSRGATGIRAKGATE